MLAILAAVMLAATAQHDTVFMADGGRVVGTVVEEGPQGVAVQLVDGTFRRFARRDVVRIEYADGTVSTLKPVEPPLSPPAQAAPPAPAPPPRGYAPPSYTPPPPPSYTPPPPPPYAPRPYGPPPYGPPPYGRPAAWPGGPVSPVYLSFGLGGAVLSGRAERFEGRNVDMDSVFDPQLDLVFEGGVRLSRHLALGLYADIGRGDPAREIRDQCNAFGFDCDASSGRLGVLLRHTFAPAARTTPWIAVGTGYEYGSVWASDTGDEQFRYSGWEMLRLMGGVDLRSSPVFGVGLYGGLSFGRYSRFESLNDQGFLVTDHIGDRRTHTTVEGGLRFTLFP